METWQQAGDTSALELMLIEVESHGLAELDTLLSFDGTAHYIHVHTTQRLLLLLLLLRVLTMTALE